MAGEARLAPGTLLEIELDEEGEPTGVKIQAVVTGVSILHTRYKKDGKEMLGAPYICVGVDSQHLRCFNYGLYWERGWVKLLREAPREN